MTSERTLQVIRRLNEVVTSTSSADAGSVTTANAGATYTATEQSLINEIKSDYNATVTLINEMKADLNAILTELRRLA